MNTEARPVPETPVQRRGWVVLLYFYVAALVGLGLVLVGTTTVLFGVRNAALPAVGLPASYYEYNVRSEPERPASDAELAVARDRAIEDRRARGVDDIISGAILAGVGVPVLIWHLRRGRRVAGSPGRPGV